LSSEKKKKALENIGEGRESDQLITFQQQKNQS
jgi:hypothetical protein